MVEFEEKPRLINVKLPLRRIALHEQIIVKGGENCESDLSGRRVTQILCDGPTDRRK